MQRYIVDAQNEGMSLEKFVKKVLNKAPLSFIYKAFRKKDIKVNGHWEKEKYHLKNNDVIEIYISDEQIKEFERKNSIVSKDEISKWIIYEDKNLLIINKPRGILVQKDASGMDRSLDEMVLEYLAFKGEYNAINPSSFKPGPAHRLDRNTSGLVLFGKNHDTLVYLFELLKEHELIGKHYLTLVVGEVEKDGEVDAPLRKNFDLKKVVVASKKDGAKEAKTIYHVKERYEGYTLLDITLVTGRTHQIRVHMSYIRHHVVGDSKYGDFKANNIFKKEYNFTNQFLHAYSLHFGKLKKPLDYLSSKSFIAPLNEEYNVILNSLKKKENND